MKNIEYVDIRDLDRCQLLAILNEAKVREHLVTHEKFDNESLGVWLETKAAMNTSSGCRVRGIKADGMVAGWCGVQLESGIYELAIVVDSRYWGIGVSVFKEILKWAAELGHQEVVLHLFHTRPEYRFLRKMASSVYQSTIYGETYTSYRLTVPYN